MRRITTFLVCILLLFNLSGCFILESFFIEEDECTEYRILYKDDFSATNCAWSTSTCGTGQNWSHNRMMDRLYELREENPDTEYWTECVDYCKGNEPDPVDPWGF